jgi:hypothetical protein
VFISIVEQRGQAAISLEYDVASVPAVTTCGTTTGDKLLAAECDYPVSAIACLNVDLNLVYEHFPTLGTMRDP